MDIKKPTYRDRPTDKVLSFSWSWRPKSLEQLDDAIRLTARIRDVRVLRGYILGLAIKVFREGPQRWISYSRNKNWYRWATRSRYWPVRRWVVVPRCPASACFAGGGARGALLLPASLVVVLPPVLASLVVVGAFYSGDVIGLGAAA